MHSRSDLILHGLRRVAWTASNAPGFLGILALGGWLGSHAGIPSPANTPSALMPPNAGALFTLLALGYSFGVTGRRWRLAAGCAGVVALLAVLRIVETLPRVRTALAAGPLSLDAWVFDAPGRALGLWTPVARLSPLTALAFALGAGAVVLLGGVALPRFLRQRAVDWLAGALGVVLFVIGAGDGLTHLLGHTRGLDEALTAGSTVAMSAATALGFTLLGLGLTLTATAHDMTERRAANRRRRAEHSVTRALASSATLAEVAPGVLSSICESLHWSYGALWSREPGEETLRCVALWRTPGAATPEADEFAALSERLSFPQGVGMPGRVWESGQPEWLDNLEPGLRSPRGAAALAAGFRGAFAVPVRMGGECYGAIEFFSPDPTPPDADLLSMMTSIGAQLALFLRRVRAEDALSRERDLLRAVIDNLPDHIYMKDSGGRYVVDNLAHSRFLGLPGQEAVVGKTVFDFFPAELAGKFADDDQLVLGSGRPILNREEPITAADGGRGWVLTSKLPFRDSTDGRLLGLVCVSRDITAQKRAETDLHAAQLQLIQAEKLESLGRLAAGIAHEVKNPLAMLQIGIDYLAGDLEMQSEPDPASTEILDTMRESVRRADTIIREMLDFSAPKPLAPHPEDLNALIQRTLPLVRHELAAAEVWLDAQLAEALPPVALDRDKIQQVLINLLTNAVHAMGAAPSPLSGGPHTLTVRTRARCLEAPEAESLRRDEGSRRNERCRTGDAIVSVEIADTGTGIAPAQLANLFDPFFTTKATGKGTGLGLTVTRKIVELHGGEIRVGNRTDGQRGASVTLIFKALPAGAEIPVETKTFPEPAAVG